MRYTVFFPIPCSLFPTPYSLLPNPYSLLPHIQNESTSPNYKPL
ncbi:MULTISPECIES: hypothetical protein [unclassified Moorena]|nr:MULTISPECIES: hypothetical protein [unclassified Moorena]